MMGKPPSKIDVTGLALREALFQLRVNKPGDRSERDRYWAIAITDMEKVFAFFDTWIAKSHQP